MLKHITPDTDGGYTLLLDGQLVGHAHTEAEGKAQLDALVNRRHAAPAAAEPEIDLGPEIAALPSSGAVLQLYRRHAALRAAGRLEEAARVKAEAAALVAADFDRLLPEQRDPADLGPDDFAEPAVRSVS